MTKRGVLQTMWMPWFVAICSVLRSNGRLWLAVMLCSIVTISVVWNTYWMFQKGCPMSDIPESTRHELLTESEADQSLDSSANS